MCTHASRVLRWLPSEMAISTEPHPVPAGEHAFRTEEAFVAWLSDHPHLLDCPIYLGMNRLGGATFEARWDVVTASDGDNEGEERLIAQRVTLHVPGGTIEEDYSELHPDDHKLMPNDGWLVDEWDVFTENDAIELRFRLRELGSPEVTFRTAVGGELIARVDDPVVGQDQEFDE